MVKQNPLISVIVPTIGRDTLERTIQSIVDSNYPNLEIIVSGALKDYIKIKNLCLNFPDIQFAFDNSNNKLSPARAKNNAIKIAKGTYLTFLDDDDSCYPLKFFVLSKHLEEHPETFACFGQYDVRDCYSGKIKNVNCGGRKNPNFDSLIISNYIASGSIMYRNGKEIYFDESIDFGEDWMMNLRLISKYKFDFIPIAIYAWTKNLKDGYTAKYNKAKINWRKIVEKNRQKAIRLWKKI